jgi:alkylated DNA repair protein alkB family protein 8
MVYRGRRLQLLRELAAVLVPGGRALVTVWATEQEDPAKTIHKWRKLRDAQGPVQQQQQEAQQQQQQEGGDGGPLQQQQQDAAAGPDYLVPWHVPFHRAGGLLQKQQQQQQQQQEADGTDLQQAGSNCTSNTSAADQHAAAAGIRVDQSKGAVVLQRYYHLFDQGELEGLVCDVPGVAVVDVFYDRSNWCVVFEKQP